MVTPCTLAASTRRRPPLSSGTSRSAVVRSCRSASPLARKAPSWTPQSLPPVVPAPELATCDRLRGRGRPGAAGPRRREGRGRCRRRRPAPALPALGARRRAAAERGRPGRSRVACAAASSAFTSAIAGGDALAVARDRHRAIAGGARHRPAGDGEAKACAGAAATAVAAASATVEARSAVGAAAGAAAAIRSGAGASTLRDSRHLGEAEVHQPRHLGVARGAGLAAHHRDDHPLVAALRRGDEVEARRPGVAGLDAVGARIGVEQPAVGVLHGGDAGRGRVAAEDVVILREIVDQPPAERSPCRAPSTCARRGSGRWRS